MQLINIQNPEKFKKVFSAGKLTDATHCLKYRIPYIGYLPKHILFRLFTRKLELHFHIMDNDCNGILSTTGYRFCNKNTFSAELA